MRWTWVEWVNYEEWKAVAGLYSYTGTTADGIRSHRRVDFEGSTLEEALGKAEEYYAGNLQEARSNNDVQRLGDR